MISYIRLTSNERSCTLQRKGGQGKSPVQENVKKFEGKPESPVQENVRRFEGKSTSENLRSKSPNINNPRPNTLYSPTRSKSPGVSSLRSKSPGISSPVRNESPGQSSPLRSESPGLASPLRSKSPGLSSPLRSKSPLVNNPARKASPTLSSPSRSKSPGLDAYNRSKSPGFDSYNRSNSPGNDAYARNKSPEVNAMKRAKSPLVNSPTRSKSPGIVNQSPASSPTKSPSKWTMSQKGWTKESPVIPEKANIFEGTPDDENLPTVGDPIDISWYFDNIEYVADTKAEETQAFNDVWPGAENHENSNQSQQRFRNSLNYNITAWDDEDFDDRPKNADDFIQRLCDQVKAT